MFTSPRARARTTCDLAGLGARASVDPDLAEWDYGDYEGLRSQDIREGRPGWNVFADGCPNGETPAAIAARVDRLIARLRGLEGDIALFAHGHLGTVFAARWLGMPVIEAQHFYLDAASMSVLSWDRRRSDNPQVILWNAAPGPDAPGVPPIRRAGQPRGEATPRGSLH